MIDAFVNYLRNERNYSEKTICYYESSNRELSEFIRFTDAALTLKDADKDIIRNWIEYCMEKGDAANTVNKKLCAVRAFFRYLLRKKIITSNPTATIKGPKKEKPLPMFVRENEINRLIDREAEYNRSYRDILARTLIIILYETGMRRSEIAGLRDRDIDFTLHQLKVTGKRDKQRLIPFGEELEETIKDYMAARDSKHPSHPDSFLINERGKALSYAAIGLIVKEQLSLVTTIRRKSPHVLRHSFATAMLNNGASLENVQKLLGHQSVETTQVYTHTTFEQLRREYEKAHPRE
ncbi:MAG: tyrosine-type recombinase/integrase [Bacteroidaceae bacterium]|nr:tyrosine-type recombinase/integrase [Bacteroidaceae bacterium]